MSSPDLEVSTARPKTRRQTEKEQRRQDLLEAAGRLFGTRGYASVALDDVGSEAGVSGQAIYRHFRGKQDMLAQLLLEVSQRLLDGARRIRTEEPDLSVRLDRLIIFQVDFALSSPEIIRVQDQEMPRLLDGDRRRVRRMQREYMDVWSGVLRSLHPEDGDVELRMRVHAVFGLINSTAHSMKYFYRRPPSSEVAAESAQALAAMARAAVGCEITSRRGEGLL